MDKKKFDTVADGRYMAASIYNYVPQPIMCIN